MKRVGLAILVLASIVLAENNNLGPATITPGKMTESQPAKPSDRAAQSKAAAAAARAGAGMQRVMCMMMMADALGQSDPTNKAMEMMMASQACQQASQTEQDADKNDKQNKMLTQDEIPKQGSFTAGTFNLKETMGNEPKLPSETKSYAAGGTPPSGSDVALVSPPSSDSYTLRNPTSAPTDPPMAASFAPEQPTTPLKPIPNGNVNYNENAPKNPPAGSRGTSVGGGTSFSSTRTLAQESSKADGADKTGSAASGEGAKGRKSDSVPEGTSAISGSPGGSGGDGEKGGGNEAFDALLAQMMGGGGNAGSEGPQMSGQDIVVLPQQKQENTKLPNIFEFANWRYQKAAFEEGRVRTPTPKTPAGLPQLSQKASRGTESPNDASLKSIPGTAKVARASKH